MGNRTNSRTIYYVQLLCALVGALISLYLVVQHTRLKNGIQESASFCNFGKYADCDVVNASPYSEVAGIPIASAGAVFYFLVLIIALLGPPGTPAFGFSQRIVLWLGTLAVFVAVVGTIIQIGVLHTVCIMCLATYLATAGIVITSLKMRSEAGRTMWSAWKNILTGSGGALPDNSRLSRPTLMLSGVAFLGLVGLVAAIPSLVKTETPSYARVENALTAFYNAWKEMPARNIEISSEDATYGNPNAKVKIVTFSDFECPHCQKAAFTLHAVMKSLSDRVYFVFKNFPLDKSCNTAVQNEIHRHACSLARLAYCSNQKGKFWEYHDIAFLELGPDELRTGVDSIAPKLSSVFARNEITACLRNEKSLARVQADIKQGNQLGIRGTPAVFVNGRFVSIPVTVETLNKLVELEELR